MDPKFLHAIPIRALGDKLEIPASIMGSGLGAGQVYSGDYDIQLFDERVRRKYGLDDLRLGDLL